MKKLLKRISTKWNRRLERLTEMNKKLYGSGRLYCCTLNRERDEIPRKNTER